ncbi:serine/threonine-protein kinase [Streptomyces chiangmaiensis]|uniref:non-specific serine/threonine protein kinase n=1 Tax=Streptomyces chiangmaiensis TaxID=766497 RepID=A0ABU7FFM2_9ACTN|nr:serine/threonine-protein kinase [Streptomyces chiangmaiensis]MED7822153.1 serine/threonine-protein kinase [Streptomyces chiangmaiensis]
MSNHGGGPQRPDEPTSFGLQPPRPIAPYPGNPYAQPQADSQPPAASTQVVPDAPRDSGAGRLVAGRYRLLAKLGHGGMGTVWRAKDETVDREVAVKEPRVPDHLPEREQANAYERMRREARAAARLDHPAVVNVHDVAVVDSRPWIVMELVQGRSLGDVLQEGTLGVREAARIGLEVLGALEAAHAAGILHRDVKPDNVLLGRYDRVVLTDFGIAQIEGETSLTDTGGFVGSPEYIAPERVLGRRPGPASDLWSLGVVLYAATEGVSPFRRANTPATLQSVLHAAPAAPASARGPLADAINGLLNKDPGRRPNATEVRRLLDEAAREPQPTQGVPLTVPGGRGIRLGRKALLGIGAGVVAMAVAVWLVVADPFAGPLPDGWTQHQEKALGATLAVPADYQVSRPEKDATDKNWVMYSDWSGSISVTLQLAKKSEDSSHQIKDSSAAEMYADNGEFKDSGAYELQMPSGPKKTHPEETRYHGRQAAENTVPYRTNDSRHQRPRELKIFYYKNTAGDMYKLTVGYPGEGDFTERGREVARTAIANLDVDRL